MATFAKSTFSAASYAAFRPSYPASLFNTVLAFHRGPKKLCLDLGCGTGLVTREMGQHYERVIGTDPSPGMIKQAGASVNGQASNIEFREGSAEASPFVPDGRVDCVVAGQAAHWFDYAKLWPEMARLVRKGGTLAFWGYKDHVFVDFPRATAVMQSYAYDPHPDRLGSYWSMPGRGYVQDKLRVIQPPAEHWDDVQRIEYEPAARGRRSGEGTLFMEKSISIGQCKEYVRTWSSFHGWQEKHPQRQARSKGGQGDVMDDMFDEIARETAYFGDENHVINMEWGSGLVMARRR